MKTLSIILLTALAFTAFIGVAYVVRINQDDDPLAANKVELQKVRILKDIESLRLSQERERQASAKLAAKLAKEKAEQERQATIQAAAIVVNSRTLAAAVWPVLPLFLLASGMTGAGLFYFFRRVPVETPFVKASLPVRRAAAIVEKSLTVSNAAEMARSLAFSEEISRARMNDAGNFYRSLKGMAGRENVIINNALPEHAETQQQAGNVSFRQAVKQFQQGSILIGYDSTGNPVFFPLTDFVSCAFGGGSGSGKTSKLRFLTAQLILQGVNVSILDAHAGNDQALVDSLGNLANMPNVRIFPAFETRQAVETMLTEVQAAIHAGKPADVPSVYVLDELRPLNRACEKVETLLDLIANEGRKYDRFMVASSQTWEASLFGKLGSAARDACVLKMAANMPKEQARILFKENDTAKKVCKLRRPEMYAQSTLFDGVVTVPFCTRSDLDELAASRMSKHRGTTQPLAAGRDERCETNTETPEPVNASEGKIDNVISFKRREPTNQLRTKSEPDTFDVKKLRESAGLSQGKFAELTGCSLSKLKRVETGGGSFDADEIQAILTNLDAWQKSSEPANQLRTNGEPDANQRQTKHEPTNQTCEA